MTMTMTWSQEVKGYAYRVPEGHICHVCNVCHVCHVCYVCHICHTGYPPSYLVCLSHQDSGVRFVIFVMVVTFVTFVTFVTLGIHHHTWNA